jgi:hypothetical protein
MAAQLVEDGLIKEKTAIFCVDPMQGNVPDQPGVISALHTTRWRCLSGRACERCGKTAHPHYEHVAAMLSAPL